MFESLGAISFVPVGARQRPEAKAMPEGKTALVILVHGYGDSGVTQKGFEQSINDIARFDESQDASGINEDALSKSGSIIDRWRNRKKVSDIFEAGRSGLLTNFAAHLALKLCQDPGDNTDRIDIISPTLKREKKWLPKDASMFSGGTEGRAFELLDNILDWINEQPNSEDDPFTPPDEIIIAGHSLGAPTVSELFRILDTCDPDDERINGEKQEAFIKAKALFLGQSDSETIDSESIPSIRVVSIDGAHDPHHSLLLRQKMRSPDAEPEDAVTIIKKKPILFPLSRAIGRGTVEQISDVMSMNMSLAERAARLGSKLPRLIRVLAYTAQLPAVLHEAGSVVGIEAVESFAHMTHLIKQRDGMTSEARPISQVHLMFHEGDQIFPAPIMVRQHEDPTYALEAQHHIPEAVLVHNLSFMGKVIRELTGFNAPLSPLKMLKRSYWVQKNIASIALEAARRTLFENNLKPRDLTKLIPESYITHVLPDGSHTSIGGMGDAKNAVNRLYASPVNS